jgi:hypothetical protein
MPANKARLIAPRGPVVTMKSNASHLAAVPRGEKVAS